MRVLLMLACFAGAGYNVWLINEGSPTTITYVSAAICLGSGVFCLASLVRYP